MGVKRSRSKLPHGFWSDFVALARFAGAGGLPPAVHRCTAPQRGPRRAFGLYIGRKPPLVGLRLVRPSL